MTVVFMFCEGYVYTTFCFSSSFIPLDTESNEGMEERKEKREGGASPGLELGRKAWFEEVEVVAFLQDLREGVHQLTTPLKWGTMVCTRHKL